MDFEFSCKIPNNKETSARFAQHVWQLEVVIKALAKIANAKNGIFPPPIQNDVDASIRMPHDVSDELTVNDFRRAQVAAG
jgi:hypothetical protein